MEPQIKYVRTADGVNMAYYAIGQGPAMLYLSMPVSHLEAEWQIDPMRMGVHNRGSAVHLRPAGPERIRPLRSRPGRLRVRQPRAGYRGGSGPARTR